MKSKKIAKNWNVFLYEFTDDKNLKLGACYMSNACVSPKIYTKLQEDEAEKVYNSLTSKKKLIQFFPDAIQKEKEFNKFLGIK